MTDAAVVLSRAGLDDLVAALVFDGYTVIGPTVRDDAVVLAELTSGRQPPDQAMFGHSAGSQSWKQFLHPPRQRLWSTDSGGFSSATEEPVRYAFLGVRACDLAAIATLGTVLGGGADRSVGFARRRQGLFVVAAGCTEPGACAPARQRSPAGSTARNWPRLMPSSAIR